jgi:hypothetical protein
MEDNNLWGENASTDLMDSIEATDNEFFTRLRDNGLEPYLMNKKQLNNQYYFWNSQQRPTKKLFICYSGLSLCNRCGNCIARILQSQMVLKMQTLVVPYSSFEPQRQYQKQGLLVFAESSRNSICL